MAVIQSSKWHWQDVRGFGSEGGNLIGTVRRMISRKEKVEKLGAKHLVSAVSDALCCLWW